MGEIVSAIEAIEKAMEGVTPGPWYPGHLGTDSTCQCRSIVDDGRYMGAIATVHVSNGLRVGEGGNDAPPTDEAAANMRYIAACNPVAMREVLAAARKAEALQRALQKIEGRVAGGTVVFGQSHEMTVQRVRFLEKDIRDIVARALLGGDNAE